AIDHRLRHVRPPGRAFLHEGEDVVRIDGHPELRQTRRDAVHALSPLLALRAEKLLEPPGLPVQAVAEHVDLGAGDVAVDLQAGDDLERGQAARLVHRLPDPTGRIVVGHGEHAHAVTRGQPYQLAGRAGAAGRGRVRVQIARAGHR